MIKRLAATILAAMMFVAGMSSSILADDSVPYETSVFKAEYPTGSRVEQREKRTDSRAQHTFQARVFANGVYIALASVEYTDLSLKRFLSLEEVAQELARAGAGEFFLPGTVQTRPVTNKTIGDLPAKEIIYYGIQPDKKAGVFCQRIAIKNNRVWWLMTAATRGTLSEQASMKFFDSVKIKQ